MAYVMTDHEAIGAKDVPDDRKVEPFAADYRSARCLFAGNWDGPVPQNEQPLGSGRLSSGCWPCPKRVRFLDGSPVFHQHTQTAPRFIEKWCRYGGSIKPISVVRDAFRKEQLLQPLLVIERRLHPEV